MKTYSFSELSPGPIPAFLMYALLAYLAEKKLLDIPEFKDHAISFLTSIDYIAAEERSLLEAAIKGIPD